MQREFIILNGETAYRYSLLKMIVRLFSLLTDCQRSINGGWDVRLSVLSEARRKFALEFFIVENLLFCIITYLSIYINKAAEFVCLFV